MEFEQIKKDYALKTNKGISMFYGGMLIWLILGILSFILPEKLNAFVYLASTGLFLPVGILISKLMKIDFFVYKVIRNLHFCYISYMKINKWNPGSFR